MKIWRYSSSYLKRIGARGARPSQTLNWWMYLKPSFKSTARDYRWLFRRQLAQRDCRSQCVTSSFRGLPAAYPVFPNRCLRDPTLKGVVALLGAGAIIRTVLVVPVSQAYARPYNGLSIRHVRNFPRTGSTTGEWITSAVALMDARLLPQTAVNGGYLTSAANWIVGIMPDCVSWILRQKIGFNRDM